MFGPYFLQSVESLFDQVVIEGILLDGFDTAFILVINSCDVLKILIPLV
jgi:hypothetical protein